MRNLQIGPALGGALLGASLYSWTGMAIGGAVGILAEIYHKKEMRKV